MGSRLRNFSKREMKEAEGKELEHEAHSPDEV